ISSTPGACCNGSMNKILPLAVAACLLLSACAPGSQSEKRAGEGAAYGAVGGAVAGAVSALIFGGNPPEDRRNELLGGHAARAVPASGRDLDRARGARRSAGSPAQELLARYP